MIQTKIALFETLCDIQYNFLDSFEKILSEINKMNIDQTKVGTSVCKDDEEKNGEVETARIIGPSLNDNMIKNNINRTSKIDDDDQYISNSYKRSELSKYELMEINIINIIINMLFNIPSKFSFRFIIF